MQNELEPPQNSANAEGASEQNGQAVTPEPVSTFPPIAGFWRRFLAWLVDILVLGVVGQIFGVVLSSFLFSIGPYGRPIGLLFTIPYFGIMNSRVGGGQTLGKRWMKIAVRSKNNEPIELWRSIIRISLLTLPVLFNQWALPIFQNYAIAWFVSLIVFGLGGAILYTMIFNRQARQGIHDLLVGTYVVHLPQKPIDAFPTTRRVHCVVAGAWIGIVAIGTLVAALAVPSVISAAPLEPVMSLYSALQDDPRFFTVGVRDNTFYGSNGKTSHSLIITAWYRGRLEETDRKEVVESLAERVLENAPNIDDYDGIRIDITSAYDIGIASGNFTMSFGKSIEEWREEIY